jgi:hypothetical protein
VADARTGSGRIAPDAWMLAGAVIVVVSGIYMIRIVAPAP